MSTADGAILALSTVLSHNIARRMPFGVSEDNLLMIVRSAGFPITIIACLIASFTATTGYLLIVAFDVVLAGCVVPLFARFYVKDPSPLAALCAVIGGSLLRLILEFALPKDGFLILPFSGDEFLDFGPVSSTGFPAFIDEPKSKQWDPNTCEQTRLEDWTGLDSILSPIFSLVIFAAVHLLEKQRGKPFVEHRWLTALGVKPFADADAPVPVKPAVAAVDGAPQRT
mmetsp:Transcript_12511/g.37568  ORF Transcript_12511/g.37568 Transcript_12511/m.37568 type:complete len:227 (-) Transcript_12511:184-864(-)